MGDVQGTAARDLDLRGLLHEPDDTELRRFRRRLRRSTGIPGAASRRRLVVDTVVRSVLCVALALPIVMVVLWAPSMSTAAGAVALPLIVAAVAGFAIWFVLRPLPRRWRESRPWRRWAKLSRFATDNGFRYMPEMSAVPHGLMFQQGKHARLVDTLLTSETAFAIGSFRFTPVDTLAVGRDPVYSFLRIALPRPVPHLVLISTARRDFRGYSSVGLSFAESQRVRLEGDFDRYFAVYAPDGYGTDARYLLTPDFMVRLMDHASAFDLEFVDDVLYVYSARPWDVAEAATWAWVHWFSETIGGAALRRTMRFSDDRSSDPGRSVAPQGRRLRVAVPLVAALITAAWIGFQIIRVVLELAD